MRTIHRDIVSAIISSKDGKIWHGFRNPERGGVYQGCWLIPGGGIEEGEDKESALRREILEETGIDIAPYPLEPIEDQATGQSEKTLKDTGERVIAEMRFFVYRVAMNDKKADEISVTLDDEFSAYKWFSPEELKDIPLSPPSVALFKKLGYL